jgi:hypothetical protein
LSVSMEAQYSLPNTAHCMGFSQEAAWTHSVISIRLRLHWQAGLRLRALTARGLISLPHLSRHINTPFSQLFSLCCQVVQVMTAVVEVAAPQVAEAMALAAVVTCLLSIEIQSQEGLAGFIGPREPATSVLIVGSSTTSSPRWQSRPLHHSLRITPHTSSPQRGWP